MTQTLAPLSVFRFFMGYNGVASTSIFTDFISATKVFAASNDPEAGIKQWVRAVAREAEVDTNQCTGNRFFVSRRGYQFLAVLYGGKRTTR